MLHIVLVHPEIPPNTGNIGRLCAYTESVLHLIHPLGFSLDDKYLKRSGMDYWAALDWREHASWEAFLQAPDRPQRLWLFTTKATRLFWEADFVEGDGLVFGSESAGVSPAIHEYCGEQRLKIPQFADGLRSLNLSTSVGIAAYEALRQVRS